MNYGSVSEFILDMIKNEGRIFFDEYGRQWLYEKYKFYFKDIATTAIMKEGISCLHLFESNIYLNR